MLTAAVRALHTGHPGAFVTDYVGHHGRLSDGNNLFANNPFITELEPWDGQRVMCDYGYAVNRSGRPFHFLYGFVEHLSRTLGVPIELTEFRGDLYLSDSEREPWPGLPERYWLIDAGSKRDFTAKQWDVRRFQEAVDALAGRVSFVQIGSAADVHPELRGVTSLVGRTNLRELIRVVYRAEGVVTPVSMPMHLAAAVPMPGDTAHPAPVSISEMHIRYSEDRLGALRSAGEFVGPGPAPPGAAVRTIRPCIVLGGRREDRHWEQYPGHTYLGDSRKLSCNVGLGKACWRHKTVKVDSDKSTCFMPIDIGGGVFVPECLHNISAADLVRAVEEHL